MQSIIEAVPGHDKEVYGVSVESVIAAGLLLVIILVIRELTGFIFPKIFGTISLGSDVAKVALSNSEKHLELLQVVGRGCILSKIWTGLFQRSNLSW